MPPFVIHNYSYQYFLPWVSVILPLHCVLFLPVKSHVRCSHVSLHCFILIFSYLVCAACSFASLVFSPGCFCCVLLLPLCVFKPFVCVSPYLCHPVSTICPQLVALISLGLNVTGWIVWIFFFTVSQVCFWAHILPHYDNNLWTDHSCDIHWCLC